MAAVAVGKRNGEAPRAAAAIGVCACRSGPVRGVKTDVELTIETVCVSKGNNGVAGVYPRKPRKRVCVSMHI